MKVCTRCRQPKPLTKFSVNRQASDGLCASCKDCRAKLARVYWLANRDKFSEKSKRFIAKHPEKVRGWKRRYKLRKNYGITPEQVADMQAKQNGLCAVKKCGRPASQIDHCHTTGKVRGLLCPQCNKALGQVADSVERLIGLAEYLRA